MFKKLKNFIRKIQKSDLKTRRRWLYIFSFIIILFIVILWRIYLGFAIKDINQSQGNGFLERLTKEYEIFKKGWNEVKNDISSQFRKNFEKIENEINKEKEIEISQTTTLNINDFNLETSTNFQTSTNNNPTSSLDNLNNFYTSTNNN